MKNLITILTFVVVGLITGCQKDDFKEVIGVWPVVLSTSPEDGATGVAPDKVITVTFNEKMNPAPSISHLLRYKEQACLREHTHSPTLLLLLLLRAFWRPILPIRVR